MSERDIRFDDGAQYERSMGTWSQLAGNIFLNWLAPPAGLRWLDIGCGNGAFTELVAQRCVPAELHGCDSSEAQLAFARNRPLLHATQFHWGDATKLPYATERFDIAVMALVVVFLPDPARGIAEMVRVVRPGGLVATYVWDMLGGGFPLEPMLAQLREMGLTPLAPRQVGASRMNALRRLWIGAGLQSVETHEITVRRTFANFDEFWSINTSSATVAPTISALARDDVTRFRNGVRARLLADPQGRIIYEARAHAIKGSL